MIVPKRSQATVPWGDLIPDLALLGAGLLAMVLSFLLDACLGRQDYFSRSGAIAVLCSGIVAFRSLNKHYRKILNYEHLANVPTTSLNQRWIDRYTLCLSIVGSVVWGYGDIVFRRLWQ